MNNLTVIRYEFKPYFSGYFQEGNFYSECGKLLKRKFYNGRACVDFKGKRYGIVKMRKFAQKKEVEITDCPF